MDNNEYMNKLSKKLSNYFDIQYNKYIGDTKFDLFARFYQRNSAFLLSKKLEYYSYQNFEYIFYKNISNNFNKSNIESISNFINNHIKDIVNLNEEHMSTILNFVYCGNVELDKETKKAIKKFKYYKSFLFGLKGWVNVKVVVINPTTKDLYTNKLAKGDRNKYILN